VESHPFLLTVAEVPGGECRINETLLRAYIAESLDVEADDVEIFIAKLKDEGFHEDDVTIVYDPGVAEAA
jgi:hypothetical protein